MSVRNMSYRQMMVMLVCVVATALLLQGLFDKSDHDKSERIVRSYRVAQDGPALGDTVEREAPGGVWSSTILSSCRGFVRVTYRTANAEYAFDYDVPQHRIHPGNAVGERLLQQISTVPSEATDKKAPPAQ